MHHTLHTQNLNDDLEVSRAGIDSGDLTTPSSGETFGSQGCRYGVVRVWGDQAGITDRGNLLDTTPELFDRMMAVNVRAPFFLTQR
jgi:NAD(P)-dependent dehydrogenase (short-subunit alcohol dehydrogenase family)